jgi:hypothetical protein
MQITARAATAIASVCNHQHVSDGGGLRIAPRSPQSGVTVRSLVIEFVDGSHPWDTVLTEGEARVFLADGVAQVVGDRVLDVDAGVRPPQLVLRSPHRTSAATRK